MLLFDKMNLMKFEPTKFRDFIRKKFSLWRGEGRDSLKDYALYVGVSQQVMSNWYNGRLVKRPQPDSYLKLVEKYGLEVYDAIGLPRLGDDLEALRALLDFDELCDAIIEYRAELLKRGITRDTPEGREIIRAAFNKFGVKTTNTES